MDRNLHKALLLGECAAAPPHAHTEETRVVQLAIRKFVSCSWRIFAGVEGAVQTRDEQQVVPALRQLSRNFRTQLGNLTGTALVAQVRIQ